MKNKKLTLTIIGVIALVLITIGLSYAYWLITKNQTNSNLITSACLDISMTYEKNDINLGQQYPISDEDGLKLTPYEFTVINNCNVALDYQIALEATGTESSALKTTSLKVALDDSAALLSSKSTTTTTVPGAYASYILGVGTLDKKGSTHNQDEATHTIRIWIDKDAPIDERNKTFASKVTVTVGQGINAPWGAQTMAYSILSQYGGKDAINEYTGNFGTVTADGEVGLYKAQDDLGISYYFRGDVENNYLKTNHTLIETVKTGTKILPTYAYEEGWYEYDEETDEYTDVLEKIISSKYETLEDCETELEDRHFQGDADWYSDTCFEYGTREVDIYEDISYEKSYYWRIIRINGDGTIRMIFDGEEKVHNGVSHDAYIAEMPFDGNGGDDGDVFDVLYNWYDTVFLNQSFIADNIFCEDRETIDEKYFLCGVDGFDGCDYDTLVDKDVAISSGYYGYIYTYASYSRLGTNNPTPKLSCTRPEDKYSLNNNIGNGKLSRPISLITADEVMMAGATSTTNNNSYYLRSGSIFWTLSPVGFGSYYDGEYGETWVVDSNGKLEDNSTYAGVGNGHEDIENGVRPVINLKLDVPFTGDGSYETPYVITIK